MTKDEGKAKILSIVFYICHSKRLREKTNYFLIFAFYLFIYYLSIFNFGTPSVPCFGSWMKVNGAVVDMI